MVSSINRYAFLISWLIHRGVPSHWTANGTRLTPILFERTWLVVTGCLCFAASRALEDVLHVLAASKFSRQHVFNLPFILELEWIWILECPGIFWDPLKGGVAPFVGRLREVLQESAVAMIAGKLPRQEVLFPVTSHHLLFSWPSASRMPKH